MLLESQQSNLLKNRGMYFGQTLILIIRSEIEPPLRIHNQYLQYVKLAMKLLLFYEFQP